VAKRKGFLLAGRGAGYDSALHALATKLSGMIFDQAGGYL
jgi:hypothetical protein